MAVNLCYPSVRRRNDSEVRDLGAGGAAEDRAAGQKGTITSNIRL